MKLNNTQVVNRKSGMTLLELTVVILVLLSLISILFVGARAWKKGSDRSANIMNIRNIQQAVRGHQNTRGMDIGDPLAKTLIFGDEGYLKEPDSPLGGTYTYSEDIPDIGDLYVTNPAVDGADYWYTVDEAAEKLSDW